MMRLCDTDYKLRIKNNHNFVLIVSPVPESIDISNSSLSSDYIET
jgi:hypothetical protein